MTYNRKPQTVDAVLWDGTTEDKIKKMFLGWDVKVTFHSIITVQTSQQPVLVQLGYYIVKDENRNVFKMKKDEFEDTYQCAQ